MTQNAKIAKKAEGKKKKREKEREEKKKKKKWRCARRSNRAKSKPSRNPSRRTWPRSQRATRLSRVTCVLSLQPLFLGFFFSFFSDEHIFSGIVVVVMVFFAVAFAFVVVVVFFVLFFDGNWVLETRFPRKFRVKKVSHQTWTTYKNRVPKTRFIDPKSSLLDSNC